MRQLPNNPRAQPVVDRLVLLDAENAKPSPNELAAIASQLNAIDGK